MKTTVHVLSAGSAEFGFANVPNVLFKFFTHEEHAVALVERAGLRLGTLYEFRATDGWDAVRGDEKEGEFTFSLESDEPETITHESAPWFIKPIVERLGTPILSHGGTLNAIAHHPDAYIYCTSSSRTAIAASAYGKYVVEISNIEGFFTALTRHLTDDLGIASPEPHGYLAPCLYLDRTVKLRSSKTQVQEPPLAFIKPSAKHSEGEVRAIWHPAKPGTLAPIVITCPELSSYCRILGS